MTAMSARDPDSDAPPDGPRDREKEKPKPADFEYYREVPETREAKRRWGAEQTHSWGDVDDKHWTKVRGDRNDEVLEYYRDRSKAPGVEEGGDTRNQYCMQCDGVIPLSYFQFEPADDEERYCPHCGVKLEKRIHRMFNWVEIDQPHDSDIKSLLPLLAAALVVVALAVLLYVVL
jgi:hypothetical protein